MRDQPQNRGELESEASPFPAVSRCAPVLPAACSSKRRNGHSLGTASIRCLQDAAPGLFTKDKTWKWSQVLRVRVIFTRNLCAPGLLPSQYSSLPDSFVSCSNHYAPGCPANELASCLQALHGQEEGEEVPAGAGVFTFS